jgi:hypothetical protein
MQQFFNKVDKELAEDRNKVLKYECGSTEREIKKLDAASFLPIA